jgi:hypothetical protein
VTLFVDTWLARDQRGVIGLSCTAMSESAAAGLTTMTVTIMARVEAQEIPMDVTREAEEAARAVRDQVGGRVL